MYVNELRTEVTVHRPLADVFGFFSEAANLQRITPPWLRFEILTPSPIPMFAGKTIDYRLRVRGVPMRWRSEIAVWEPPGRFVDEQVRGPYRLWRHEHRFVGRGQSTDVIDHVRYSVWGGRLADRLFVRPDIERIFAFRARRIAELLPPLAPGESAAKADVDGCLRVGRSA